MKLLMLVWLMVSSCLAEKLLDLKFEEDGREYRENIVIDERAKTTIYEVPKHAKLEQSAFLIDRNPAEESLDLEFEEDGAKYRENIFIDERAKTTIYEVPKHAKLEQSAFLIDRNSGIEVIKMKSLMKCFARKIPSNEPSNNDLKETFQKVGFKFPDNKYMIENHNFAPVRKLQISEVSINVQKFCLNYEIYEVKDITMKQLETDATNFLTKARSKRSSFEWVFCTPPETHKINCPIGKNAKARCKFQQKSCVYSVSCDPKDLAYGKCKGAPTHIYNSYVCCDFSCV